MKETEPPVRIQPMQQSDIEQAMHLKNIEGWNQTKKDWEVLLRLSPKTCRAAVRGRQVIGTVTAITYSNELAWIGMMLVAEKYRRKGIGSLLVKDNIKRLKGFRNIKLDATPDGRNLYTRLGFEEECTLSRMAISSLAEQKITDSGKVTPLSPHDIQEIAYLDKAVFGADRTHLMAPILGTYPHRAWKLERDGRITAYCLGRDGIKQNQIGPVIASTDQDAQTILSAAMSPLAGQPVVMTFLRTRKNS